MALIDALRRLRSRGIGVPLAVALAAAGLFLAFGDAFRIPFINDDFVFLDRTRDAAFSALWRTDSLMFGWYRPWSRELHYWWLQRAARPTPLVFHAMSFALVLGILAAYGTLARRVAGTPAAVIAMAGVAAMGAWAVPMLWVAGAQELWMLFAVLVCLAAHAAGRRFVAAAAFAVALLSKETAAVAVGIALAYSVTVGRKGWRAAIVHTAPLFAILIGWMLIHPSIAARLSGSATEPAPGLHPGPASVVLRSLLMLVNLEAAPAPERGWLAALSAGIPPALALGALVLMTPPLPKPVPRSVPASPHPGRAAAGTVTRVRMKSQGSAEAEADERAWARFTAVMAVVFPVLWMVLAWVPLLDPRIGWHSYYGLLGALGAWLVLGIALARVPRLALAVVVIAALLRSAGAATPSSDWGSAWYQRRAGSFLEFMRTDLLQKEPSPPRASRFFFSEVPSSVGFLTEGAPALRVWYRDPTLGGGFLSQYTRRGIEEGQDLFFRYDSTTGWVRMADERPGAATPALNPRWEKDHFDLAAVFVRADDWPSAAREYLLLAAHAPDDPRYSGNAAVSLAMAGDTARAARWFSIAAGLPGADSSLKRLAREFRRALKQSR